MTVNGTQTFLNTSTLEVEDKNIVVAKGSNDSLAADGGGLTIEGPDAQLTWDHNLGYGRFKMNKDLYVTGKMNLEGHLSNKGGDLSILNSSGTTQFTVSNSNGNVFSEGEIEGSSLTDGVATMSSGSLTNVVDVTASGIVSFGTLTDSGENIAISKFVDEADGISSNDNDTSIPTSAAVKNYVDVKVASGGYSSAKLGDHYLYSLSYSTFIPAKLNTILITVDNNNSLHDVSNQQIELVSSENPVYSEFEFLAEVFLNGQKLRYDAYSGSSFSNGDFTIINNGSSSNRLIKFNSNVISDEDNLEIKYYSISHVMELNDLDYDGIIGLNDSNDVEILSSNLGIAATSGITADPNGSEAPYFTSGTYVDANGNTKSSTFFNYIYMHSSWSNAAGLSPAYPDVEVGNIETIYVVATVDEAPFQDSLHINYYTVAEGDGQDASWYRSRATLQPSDSPQFDRDVKTLFWYGQEPAADLHPDLPRVEMTAVIANLQNGPQGSSEKLLGLAVSTNTANTDGSVKIVFEKAGMISSEFTFEKEYKYSA